MNQEAKIYYVHFFISSASINKIQDRLDIFVEN